MAAVTADDDSGEPIGDSDDSCSSATAEFAGIRLHARETSEDTAARAGAFTRP